MARQKVKVSVFGEKGRMGQEVLRVAEKDTRCQIVNHEKGAPQVVVDFSSPQGTASISAWCAKNKVALVSGTTGFTVLQEKELKESSKSCALFWSPNMSFGVNALARCLQTFL